jgi:hypothetical protein
MRSSALAGHRITHIDETSGTFELRGLTCCFGELVVATGTVRFQEHTMTGLATGNDDHFSFPRRSRRQPQASAQAPRRDHQKGWCENRAGEREGGLRSERVSR